MDDEEIDVEVSMLTDLVTLGSLCVDIVLNVPELPPQSQIHREIYFDQLLKSPPHQKNWEAGANCNVAIAASRIGVRCTAIGNVGNDIYGKFLWGVLHDEGISTIQIDDRNSKNADCETLKCWVFVDPFQGHDFWSNNIVGEYSGELSSEVKMGIKQSKVLYCSCYVFYELPHYLSLSALEYSIQVGTSIFFDPGPKGKVLADGTTDEQNSVNKFLTMSDVILLTSEEAELITGITNPVLAGQELIKKGVRVKWVIVKIGSRGSILITESIICCASAFKVDVVDTVGCGDSFTAAIAFGYIHKLPLLQTLTLANAVGAATATGLGAGRNVATLNKVKQIMTESNLHTNDEIWDEYFDDNVSEIDVLLLSNKVIHQSNNRIKRVSLQNVVCELLSVLKSRG